MNTVRLTLLTLCLLFWVPFAAAQEWQQITGIASSFSEVRPVPGTDTLIARATDNMVYSPDAGRTWQPLNWPPLPFSPASYVVSRLNGQTRILMLGYAGGGSTNFFRSSDMGSTWQPLPRTAGFSYPPELLCDATGRIWWVPDEVNAGNLWLRFSDDGGDRWDSLLVPEQDRGNVSLRFAPQDPQTLWLSRSHLFVSTDRGLHWTNVLPDDSLIYLQAVNPQNPRSVLVSHNLAVKWMHGDGVLQSTALPYLLDVKIVDGDSNHVLYTADLDGGFHIYRSRDGGATSEMENAGLVVASATRIALLDEPGNRVFLTACAGGFVQDGPGQALRRVTNYPGLTWNVFFSRHQRGLIWGNSNNAIFVSSDAGVTWQPTPFMGDCYVRTEHASETDVYIWTPQRTLYRLSYPSLTYAPLTLPVEGTFVPSPADTSVLYLFSAGTTANTVYVSQDAGQSWQPHEFPGTGQMDIHPSSSQAGFVLLMRTYNGSGNPQHIYRTEDYGATWTTVYQTGSAGGMTGLEIGWSGADVRTDFSFMAARGLSEEYWCFHSTDGGLTYDSVRTYAGRNGYYLMGWGEGTAAFPWGANCDGIYTSPDYGHTFTRVMPWPEPWTTNAYRYIGAFGQVACVYGQRRAYYWAPATAATEAPVPARTAMAVYPNPTNGSAYLRLDLPAGSNAVQIRLINLLGQTVATLPIDARAGLSAPLALPVDGLASGIYIVSVDNPQHSSLYRTKMALLK